MAAVVGTSLGLGSEAYRYNLLVAPRLSRLDLAQAVDILVRTVPQNALAWGVGAWGAWSGARGEQGGRAAGRAVAAGAAVALLLGLLGIARAGGNRNHLFEAYLLLSGAAAVEVLRAEGRARAVFAGAVGLVAAFALVQLAVPNRFGTLTLDGRWRAPLRAWLAERTATGGTLLVLDDVLAQPWSSSGGRHPAYVLDPVWLEVSGTGVRRTVAQVLAQPGVTGWVATESQLQALRGGAAGCAPLPPAAGAPGWFECPR
jgi:hypothetical protein